MGAEEATLAFKTLADKEGVGASCQEVRCKSCMKFLMEVAINGKCVQRLKCSKCGTDNLIVVEADRISVVSKPA